MTSISDKDGDECHDVTILSAGSTIETSIAFADAFTIACTDYRTPEEIAALGDDAKRTVKLQFCASWLAPDKDNSCDIVGPNPCSETCWCDSIDLGVEITSTAKPTCSPNKMTTEPTSQDTLAKTPDVPSASDDQMETCMDVAVFMNVISNDVSEAGRPLKLNSVSGGELRYLQFGIDVSCYGSLTIPLILVLFTSRRQVWHLRQVWGIPHLGDGHLLSKSGVCWK